MACTVRKWTLDRCNADDDDDGQTAAGYSSSSMSMTTKTIDDAHFVCGEDDNIDAHTK